MWKDGFVGDGGLLCRRRTKEGLLMRGKVSLLSRRQNIDVAGGDICRRYGCKDAPVCCRGSWTHRGRRKTCSEIYSEAARHADGDKRAWVRWGRRVLHGSKRSKWLLIDNKDLA